MTYLRGQFVPSSDESDDDSGLSEKVKSFFSSPEEEGEEPRNLKVLFSYAGEELCGFRGIPEDRGKAKKYLNNQLFTTEPRYGTNEHRTNGFPADLDAGVFAVIRKKTINLLKDSLGGSVWISREPVGDHEHRVVVHYPLYSPDPENQGEYTYEGIETIEGEPRARKCELVVDLANIVDRIIPDIESSDTR